MVISLEDLRRNDSSLCGSFLKLVDDVKAMTADPSEQQVILTQMVLIELMMNKTKPEALFSLGFPKKKRTSGIQKKRSGIQKQSEKPRIIIKFKRCVSLTTGIASYSCSVSNSSGVDVNPDPLCGDDQKQDLKLRLRLRSKKRCYSETDEAGSEGSEVINSKRLREGDLQDRIHGMGSSD